MNSTIAVQRAARSTFVTVLAWVFIGLSSFTLFIAILQNLMMHMMFRGPEFEQAIQATKDDPQAPAFASYLFEYMFVFFALFLLVSIASLLASVGLLRRRNWARLLFIALMGVGIVWNIGGFVLQLIMFPSMSDLPGVASDDFVRQFQIMFVVMAVFGGLMALGFSALFGWIITRLVSPPIVAEFVPPTRVTHAG
jgi:hypothetical protein